MDPKDAHRRRLLGLGAGLLTMASGAVRAQAARLRLLCASPGGGIPDIVARAYAEQLGPLFPGGVLVDNRPGGAGVLAVQALKQSPPDGATMLLAHAGAVTTYPHLYPKLAYDAATDLVPVSLAADTGFALAVGAAVPADVRTLAAFIGWSRAHPALSNHGSPGQGTLPHLLAAMLFRQAGVEAQHVTYPGGPLAIQDLLGGRLAALVLPEGLLRPLHLAGKARLLATSGAARSRFLPEVPTFAEQGYPALATREWFGFFVPAETPAAAVAWAAEAVRTAAARPPLLATLGDLGMQAVVATPAAMAERIASERRAWQAVITTMGIRLE